MAPSCRSEGFKSQHFSCVPIQGLHPSKESFEGQLRHNAARRPVPIHQNSKDSPNSHFKCVLLFSRWVPLRRIHRYYPSRAPVSQDALRAAAAHWKFTTFKEVKWRRLVATRHINVSFQVSLSEYSVFTHIDQFHIQRHTCYTPNSVKICD